MPKGRILGFQGQRAALHFQDCARFQPLLVAVGIMDTLGQMFCPLPFLGVVGKGLWRSGSGVQTPSAAASSQLRGLELALSGSAPVFSLSEGSMRPRELGVQAPAGAPCPAPLGPPRLLLAGTGPTAAALLPKSSCFLLACSAPRSPPSMWVSLPMAEVPPFCWEGRGPTHQGAPHVGTAFCA